MLTADEWAAQAQAAFEQALPDDPSPYEEGKAWSKVGEHLAAVLAEQLEEAHAHLCFAMEEIACRAPSEQPDPLRDEFGDYISDGNTDDVVRDAIQNERWDAGQLARDALAKAGWRA